MSIRPAVAADAAAVAPIWNRMIRDSLATFTSVEKDVAEIAALIDERSGAFWVAEEDRVLGFATFGPFRGGPGYAATVEHTVVLAAGGQGRGLGRQLMFAVTEAAHAQGVHVMVAAISSANPAAVAFHSAIGFEQTGHMPQVGRKAGQWLDLILMQKTISAT
jgi:phosphinothricin acetyltransferase